MPGVADINEKIAVHTTMFFLRETKRCRRRIGVDAVARENFRLRRSDERFEHFADDIAPAADRTFRNIEVHVFEHAIDLAIHRQVIAVFIDEHRRDELRRDRAFVDGANRYFRDDDFIFAAVAIPLVAMPDISDHLADHWNRIEDFADLDAHENEGFA